MRPFLTYLLPGFLSLYCLISSGCYYLGMNMVAPNSMNRYSLRPQPINTLSLGTSGGRGISSLKAMEYEHPDLDTNKIETKWDYTTQETFLVWQAGRTWDFGVGWFTLHDSGNRLGASTPFSYQILQSSLIFSSMINRSRAKSWLQKVSLHQLSLTKKGYSSSIDYHEWNTIAEEIRYTYSRLFGSNPMNHWLSWGGGVVFNSSYIRLRSRYDNSRFRTTQLLKFYPGLRFFVGAQVGELNAGFDQTVFWPLIDEHIGWNFSLSFSYTIPRKH